MTTPDIPAEAQGGESGSARELMVTLRMPLSNWDGIVNGIENWAGDSASEHEILQDIELIDGDPSAIWWLNGYYEDER